MCVIGRAHVNARATSLMRVKITRVTSVYDTYCLGHWNEENEKTKTSN